MSLEKSKTPSESVENAKQQLLLAIQSLEGLALVDSVIRSKLHSDAALLAEIPTYLLNLGGKRMRPVLTLLLAKALKHSTSDPALIDIAAGIELIHMATLLHDDIIDNASLRRHQESPLKRYGQSATLLAGDFLLVRAFSLCSHLDEAIIDATEIACVHLTEGEILETALSSKQHSLESSIQIADKKTAALFELAAFSAAFIASNDRNTANVFAKFGQALGIAFQILDDILDVTSDSDLLGKPAGTDIRERKPSLVNVLWIESGSQMAQELLNAESVIDEKFITSALSEIRTSDVVAKARTIALEYTDKALVALEKGLTLVPSYDPKALLDVKNVVQYTVQRVL